MEGRITEDRVDENLTYRPFSGPGSSTTCGPAAGSSRGGGFSLLGEAVYLHKPILAIPLAGAGGAAAERPLRRAAGLTGAASPR